MGTRKRQKLEANVVAFGDVLADLDLELSLRERLADTLESRISWALILQESLEKGTISQDPLRLYSLAPRRPHRLDDIVQKLSVRCSFCN